MLVINNKSSHDQNSFIKVHTQEYVYENKHYHAVYLLLKMSANISVKFY